MSDIQSKNNSRRSLFVTLAIRAGQASNQMRRLSCASLVVILLNLNAGSKKRALSVSQVKESLARPRQKYCAAKTIHQTESFQIKKEKLCTSLKLSVLALFVENYIFRTTNI